MPKPIQIAYSSFAPTPDCIGGDNRLIVLLDDGRIFSVDIDMPNPQWSEIIGPWINPDAEALRKRPKAQGRELTSEEAAEVRARINGQNSD